MPVCVSLVVARETCLYCPLRAVGELPKCHAEDSPVKSSSSYPPLTVTADLGEGVSGAALAMTIAGLCLMVRLQFCKNV